YTVNIKVRLDISYTLILLVELFFLTENSGTFFPSVKQDPGKYLQRCPDSVKAWLQNLKNSGKVLLLITSSHSDYCRLVCEHILGHNFEDFFDIIITNALKPGFFSQIPNQRPFRNLVNDIEDCNGLASLDKPGWYSQGNWTHLNDLLKKMTRKSTPKVVYFGDSMRSDVFPASHYGNWDVVLILEELESEVIEENEVNSKDISAEPLEKKGKYEHPAVKPNIRNSKWGSYFLDDYKGINELEETQKYTWCCSCITTYSTIAIPSIEAIAALVSYVVPGKVIRGLHTKGVYDVKTAGGNKRQYDVEIEINGTHSKAPSSYTFVSCFMI
uniref:5'-nucleotidase domain-containing protein 1 n=1 Tax=Erpetoichthys calabaricus TaxID=27687 RepID=A0A8C4RS60_ERPCA